MQQERINALQEENYILRSKNNDLKGHLSRKGVNLEGLSTCSVWRHVAKFKQKLSAEKSGIRLRIIEATTPRKTSLQL